MEGFGAFPGPGECTNVGVYLRKQIYPILNRWLATGLPAEEFHHPRPDDELMALTATEAAERKPKLVSQLALDTARRHLATARTRRAGLAPAARLRELRDAWRARLGPIDPPPNAPAHALWKQGNAEAVELETAPGIRVPLLLVKPTAAQHPRVVVAFSQGGSREFLTVHAAHLRRWLESGHAVCMVEVRGTGVSGATLGATHLMLGDTAMGARLADARAALQYLRTRADLDARQLTLWGDSGAKTNPPDLAFDQSPMQQPGPAAIIQAQPLGGLLALLTALYEDGIERTEIRRGLVSYESALESSFVYLPQDIVVPGILQDSDLTDIVEALPAGSIRQEEMIDARNVPRPTP